MLIRHTSRVHQRQPRQLYPWLGLPLLFEWDRFQTVDVLRAYHSKLELFRYWVHADLVVLVYRRPSQRRHELGYHNSNALGVVRFWQLLQLYLDRRCGYFLNDSQFSVSRLSILDAGLCNSPATMLVLSLYFCIKINAYMDLPPNLV